MLRTGWCAAVPAMVLAATLGSSACGGRDDNDTAGPIDRDRATNADASRPGGDDTNPMAGNADAQDADRLNNARGMQISLVGCVQRAAPGSGRYLLTQVRTAGQGDADAAVGTSGSTAADTTPSAAGDRYELVASSEEQLGDHVGRRVKVVGRLASDTVGTSGAGEPGATGSGGAMPLRDRSSDSAQALYVSDVSRVGTETCSAASSGR